MLGHLAAGFLFMAAAPTVESAQQGVVWKWLPEPGTCALRQQIDEAGSFLQVSKTPGHGETKLMLQDRQAQPKSWRALGLATLTLEPRSSTAVESSLGPGELPRSRAVTVAISDQDEFLDKFSSASALTVSHAEFGSLRASMLSPAAAIQAIRQCEDKMLRGWGVDPTALQQLRSRPKPINSLVDWFTPDDYPRMAAIYGVGAFVVALVEVGPDGRAQSCKIVNRQPYSNFKDAVCQPLKRNARFHPAINVKGQPASAPFIVRVRFQPSW